MSARNKALLRRSRGGIQHPGFGKDTLTDHSVEAGLRYQVDGCPQQFGQPIGKLEERQTTHRMRTANVEQIDVTRLGVVTTSDRAEDRELCDAVLGTKLADRRKEGDQLLTLHAAMMSNPDGECTRRKQDSCTSDGSIVVLHAIAGLPPVDRLEYAPEAGPDDQINSALQDVAMAGRVRRSRYGASEGSIQQAQRDLKVLAQRDILKPVGRTRARYYVAGERFPENILMTARTSTGLVDPYRFSL
jgi:hypothetical protein